MPPEPAWFGGERAIRRFLAEGPLTVRWKHLPARANGQLAVGCYLLDEASGDYVAAVIDVLTLEGEKIAAVTAFLAAKAPGPSRFPDTITGAELFSRFGLPATLP